MKNPDDGVLTLLDVAGSCIVDIFYNHMYDRAIVMHEKTARGLTECYRQVLAGYIHESSGPRFYNTLLNSLHHYMRMSTIYQNISYSDSVALYASLFIPNMYTASLTAEQKLNILSMVLGNTIRAFREEVVRDHIAYIIDDHSDPENVGLMQDGILKNLLRQREQTYDEFIRLQRHSTKSGSPKPTTPPHVDTAANNHKVTQEVLTKLTAAFKRSVAERMDLKKSNTELQKRNQELVIKFEDLRQMFLKQLTDQKELTKLVNDLKTKLHEETAKNNATVTTRSPPLDNIAISTSEDVEHDNNNNDDDDNSDLFKVRYIEEYDENRV